ncbi:Defensin-like protein 156 [Arabidopsis thaliana]|uniref:Defensin-like protein 156 n=3 Tax=Arabidopsis TaxID=3701 RepID=DF156_ARATH|nr:low-molecular-weight cysteine-rich 21 [Arabidopsis thaliana]P82735.1 RecName: Full=Defensin-like protein 156; AltName: Full=Low-molecular-weight cysteine-rich protein 21; Short=Protein LCR21; Flags: Precursor [Arabidopsis thaliana]AEE85612.1 low-molecular-weight cysteine-rich 21 [Arabidopsis thaliana]KAG7617766.1 S locus-related glycoprotein 1 binding pollen coat protein [Arabidopsis thaliana x Arabidopsis arenosa]KAG7622229.1 S locus-related glycoprotein 1 binding pollen coat protein [Arabi|eukprot:NP_001031746.1 low-molecular-weight cysteine-rich 21 [Arabidopsis thaliana]
MAKISCSYFLVLMLVFSVFSLVEKTKGKRHCSTIILPESPCVPQDCVEYCFEEYNGGGTCIASKTGRTTNCMCTYNCHGNNL